MARHFIYLTNTRLVSMVARGKRIAAFPRADQPLLDVLERAARHVAPFGSVVVAAAAGASEIQWSDWGERHGR